MPGLAFPSSPAFARENSFDYGASTPFSNVDDIPIDPALNGPPIDPAILADDAHSVPHDGQHRLQFPLQMPTYTSPPLAQYSPGPQGDPFAPQPLPAHLVPEDHHLQPTKPPKKKRRPRREEECGFCQGNDSKNNKTGEPEIMVTCDECARSGHPSCMDLGQVSEIVRSYPWKCMECKACEICQEKGDDSRILFCDFCDRGWHMDCLDPPIETEPPGRWHCPLCPPLLPSEYANSLPPDPFQRASSVASTSHSAHADHKGKGKAKGTLSDDSEMDVDENTTTINKSKKKSSRKGKARHIPDGGLSSLPKRMRQKISSPPPQRRMVVRLRLPPRGKGKEREEDNEPPKGLFDDVLSVDDRDTLKTSIEAGDKIRFERSRTVSEAKVNPMPPVMEGPRTPVAGPSSSRPLRSSANRASAVRPPSPGPSASPAPSTPDLSKPDIPSRPLRIRTIRFGDFDIQTWYDAPFPEEYANIPDGRLWICEFCLKYMKSRFQAVRHGMKCKARHPPGDEIYRDGAVTIFEVDGRKNKIYCQNLCLLSKMFLDHKSLFYDVEPFLFYVMTEVDDVGARFVGYFSKEKRSPKDYNVSCIMTLPVRQRRGWGNLLIDFSYLLSKKERRSGSPEKPLSGLGALSYKNYWTLAVMQYLHTAPDNPKLEDISAATSMTLEDIYHTLVQLNIITIKEHMPASRPAPGQSFKFPKGRKNGIARRHLQRTQTQDGEEKPDAPFAPPKDYEIHWNPEDVAQYLANWESKGHLRLKLDKLKWSPFLLARTRKTQKADAPAAEALAEGSSLAKSEPMNVDVTTVTPDPGPSTPRKNTPHGTPARLNIETMRTESPAAALFDGDVEVTDARSMSVMESTTTPNPVHRSFSPNFRYEGESSKAPALSKTAPARLLPPRYTRSQSTRMPVSPTLRRARSGTVKDLKIPNDKSNIMSDEAITARLAREEIRQLRSRSGVAQDKDRKRGPSESSPRPRSCSPRKRRRIESSPEADTLSPSTSSPPVNGHMASANPVTTVTRHRHRQSGMTNGSDAGGLSASQPLVAARTSSLLNGASVVTAPVSDVTVKSAWGESVIEPPADPPDEQEPNRTPSVAADVKSEDVETPSTVVASRQSAHSEDTSVEAEAVPVEPPDKSMDANAVGSVQQNDDGAESEMDAEGDPDDEILIW